MEPALDQLRSGWRLLNKPWILPPISSSWKIKAEIYKANGNPGDPPMIDCYWVGTVSKLSHTVQMLWRQKPSTASWYFQLLVMKGEESGVEPLPSLP